MAHEFVGALRQKDWQVLEAEGNPLEQAVPYALLKKLLQSALRVGRHRARRICLGCARARPPAHSDLWPAAFAAVLDQPVSRSPLERSRTAAAAARDHRCRAPHDRQGGLDAADGTAAGGPSLDRRPERNRHRIADVARGEPPAADPADMADGGYAGMAGAARRAPDLAAVPRYRLGKCAARRSPGHGARSRGAQGAIFFATPARCRCSSKKSRGNSSIAASSTAMPAGLPRSRPGRRWKFPPPCKG